MSGLRYDVGGSRRLDTHHELSRLRPTSIIAKNLGKVTYVSDDFSDVFVTGSGIHSVYILL